MKNPKKFFAFSKRNIRVVIASDNDCVFCEKITTFGYASDNISLKAHFTFIVYKSSTEASE